MSLMTIGNKVTILSRIHCTSYVWSNSSYHIRSKILRINVDPRLVTEERQ
jgi:hypothetical protein